MSNRRVSDIVKIWHNLSDINEAWEDRMDHIAQMKSDSAVCKQFKDALTKAKELGIKGFAFRGAKFTTAEAEQILSYLAKKGCASE